MTDITDLSPAAIAALLVAGSPIAGLAIYGLILAGCWLCERVQDGW